MSTTRSPSGMVTVSLTRLAGSTSTVDDVVGGHLLLECVVADLDLGRLGVGGRGVGEGLDRGDDAGGLQVAAHLGDGVALVDLEGDLAAARARVVLRGPELVADRVDAAGDHEVEAADDDRQRDQHGQAAGDVAALRASAVAPARPTTRSTPPSELVPGLDVDSPGPAVTGSWSGSCASLIYVSSTISPGAEPVARSVSSAFCRMRTAAAWSTTARRLPPLRPRSRSIASADTVVIRSSHSRTGTGRTRRARVGGELAHLHGRRSLTPRERARQPDDDLDRLLLGEDRRDPGQVALAAPYRLDRRRQEPRGVAAGHPDPGIPRIDAEAYAGTHQAVTTRPTSVCTRAIASSMRLASVPPPCATSSLPPPLPPTSGPIGADQVVGAQACARGPRR